MLIANTDHAFAIGSRHVREGSPCEDYATSGGPSHLAYAVVSDGCSTGGETDVGARLIALTMVRAIRDAAARGEDPNPLMLERVQEVHLTNAMAALAVPRDDLFATCVSAVWTPTFAFARIMGDGAVFWEDVYGMRTIVMLRWESSMPFYPIYRMSAEHVARFIEAHGSEPTAIRAHLLAVKDGFPEVSGIQLREGIFGYTMAFGPDEAQKIRRMAVFTDGIEQVGVVPPRAVIGELTAFKTTSGQFAKRRLRRMLTDWAKEGHEPQDDIGYAVINVEEV